MQGVDELIRDMRKDLKYPPRVFDEASAVQRYLAYLSMLVDIALAEIAMSALHENDIPIIYKQRLLIEYACKARYFHDHPDYALYMCSVNEAESVLRKFTLAGAHADEIERFTKDVDDAHAEFPQVAHLHALRFDEIMAEVSAVSEYVWLYKAPSALLHGDPEGMRQMLSSSGDGPRPTIALSDETVNALLVDAASNALVFCETFIERMRPGDEEFKGRLGALARRTKELILKYPDEREPDAIDALRQELGAG